MREKKPFIVQLAAGLFFAGAGLAIQVDYYSRLLCAMGIGIAFSSAIQLIRMFYWQNPGRREAYEEKKREAHINSVDERKQYLRMKASAVTYRIMALAVLLLAFLLTLVRVEAWVVAMVFLIFIVQWITGLIVYRVLEKRV